MVKKIEEFLKRDFAERIISEQEFYFQKGQDALNKWLNYHVDEVLEKELLDVASNYEGIQKKATSNVQINDILKLLFEIISYCDTKAKDKILYNKYNDKRTLAMAYVRMNHWIEKLILFKFNRTQVPDGSPLNAFNYLLDPNNNATILSENHREMISKKILGKDYDQVNFIKEFKNYFSRSDLKTVNSNNYSYLLSSFIYSIKKDWLDDIIGLMAADNTDWKDYLIHDMNDDDCAILWNSKRPTGTSATLKMLRNKINNGEYFKLFYSVHGSVQYVAEIIDFVENDKELKKKNWSSIFQEIVWYQDDFTKYKDGNKSASIVFLAKKFNKIEPILANEFEIYKNYSYPVQDNLTPIVSEPDMTIIPPTPITAISSSMIENNSYPLNQILYGPPGTGKTYNTISKAIEIINPDFDLTQDREIIKDEFDNLVKKSQIIFTTFHQSMNYEDFIEGIKPLKPDDSDTFLSYNIEDGLFKIASASAAYLCYKKYQDSKNKSVVYTFDDLHEAFIENIQNSLDKNKPPVYKTLTGKEVTVIKINGNNSIKARAKNSTSTRNPAPLTKENLQKLYDKFNTIDEIKSLKQVKETVQITPRITEFYALFKALKEFEKKEFKPDTDLINEISEVDLIDINEITKKFNAGVYTSAISEFGKTAEPVVLIIDEINRGNVSQIFGELITLIEEDKRLGNVESLEVTLPYSKEKFGVPPNLYIIGTMNTADRSVEALDTALRRRFCFEEMPPVYDLDGLKNNLFGYDVFSILKTINSRIEKLIDRDHAIGHSYFLNKNRDSIVDSFYKNIIPLLQEYFFGDYGKIGLVLGKGFVRLKEYDKTTTVFADFDTQSASDFDERDVFEIIDYRKVKDYKLSINKNVMDMTFELAIQFLMNKKFD